MGIACAARAGKLDAVCTLLSMLSMTCTDEDCGSMGRAKLRARCVSTALKNAMDAMDRAVHHHPSKSHTNHPLDVCMHILRSHGADLYAVEPLVEPVVEPLVEPMVEDTINYRTSVFMQHMQRAFTQGHTELVQEMILFSLTSSSSNDSVDAVFKALQAFASTEAASLRGMHFFSGFETKCSLAFGRLARRYGETWLKRMIKRHANFAVNCGWVRALQAALRLHAPMLIGFGSDFGTRLLHSACRQQKTQVVRLLLASPLSLSIDVEFLQGCLPTTSTFIMKLLFKDARCAPILCNAASREILFEACKAHSRALRDILAAAAIEQTPEQTPPRRSDRLFFMTLDSETADSTDARATESLHPKDDWSARDTCVAEPRGAIVCGMGSARKRLRFE